MKKQTITKNIFLTMSAFLLLIGCSTTSTRKDISQQPIEKKEVVEKPNEETKTIRISANGDLLYHNTIYFGAKKSNGYDFNENYKHIQPLISGMDLAIGDYEGTIVADRPLSGYPLFNAPQEVASALQNAGYDVMSIANNHILDYNIYGLLSTKKILEKHNMQVIGVSPQGHSRVQYRDVNGIKVALIAYTYGFNGLEVNVASNQKYMLHDLDEDKIKQDLEEAEKNADITIAMPHMGDEYNIQPNAAQKQLYHKMINWGADIIFGNHTHVPQPAETIMKDGDKKFIIYSMGNLISNQRIETMYDIMNHQWTERGVIVEANISKTGNQKAKLDKIIYHPTWVRRTPRKENPSLFKYEVLLTENFINNRQDLSDNEYKRVKATHDELLKHLNNLK